MLKYLLIAVLFGGYSKAVQKPVDRIPLSEPDNLYSYGNCIWIIRYGPHIPMRVSYDQGITWADVPEGITF